MSRKKYYNIGFEEDELQEINAVFNKRQLASPGSYFRDRASLIKYLALTGLDLERENRRLKAALASIIRGREAAQATTLGQGEEIVWTGFLHGVRRDGKIIYTVWG